MCVHGTVCANDCARKCIQMRIYIWSCVYSRTHNYFFCQPVFMEHGQCAGLYLRS